MDPWSDQVRPEKSKTAGRSSYARRPGAALGATCASKGSREPFLTLRACPPTLLTISALGSARGHLRHEHNSKGPSWGRGRLGGPLGPPFWRWQPQGRFLAEAWRQPEKTVKRFGPNAYTKTLFLRIAAGGGVQGGGGGYGAEHRLKGTLTSLLHEEIS